MMREAVVAPADSAFADRWRLDGHIALVTGASSGLGACVGLTCV